MNKQVMKKINNLQKFSSQFVQAMNKPRISHDTQRGIDKLNYLKSISSEKCSETAEELAFRTTYRLYDLLSMGESMVEFMKNQLDSGEIVNHRDYKHPTLAEIMSK